MALPSVADFRTRFTEFADTSDGTIEIAISDAGKEIDDTVWMTKYYEDGVLFLAAHFLVSGSMQGEFVEEGGPPIKSESIGRLSTTYGDPAKSGDFSSTEYGTRYLRLLKRNAPRLAII